MTLIMLWANSAYNKLVIFFLFFLEKNDLTLFANCLLRKQFAWNVKTYFLGKIFQNVVCWNFYPACKVLIMLQWLHYHVTSPGYYHIYLIYADTALTISIDPDQTAHGSSLLRVWTICYSITFYYHLKFFQEGFSILFILKTNLRVKLWVRF